MNLLNSLTIGIKTFNRPLCLSNCLQSIRKLYPNIKIIIADDSNNKIKTNNKEIADKYNADLIDLPFDSGLSIGRNSIISKVSRSTSDRGKTGFCFSSKTINPAHLIPQILIFPQNGFKRLYVSLRLKGKFILIL